MRIAVTDTTIHKDLIGGGHLFLSRLLPGLVRSGHDVHFVSTDSPNQRVRSSIEESGATMHSRIWPRTMLVIDATPLFARWLDQLQPDVHLISTSSDLGWTVLPHLDPRIAAVMIAHADTRGFYEPLRYYGAFMNAAVGVSEEICRQFVDYSGMPSERVTWIPYGVKSREDPVDIKPSTEPIRLVFVGRLTDSQKRASDLIRIVHKLTERGVDFRFDIVGDGELSPKFRDDLSEPISNGRVVLHGWVESDEVDDILQRSNVFLLPSDSEGFCIALIEAMANGCCPVVTDIRSGNKQLVEDGVSGFVVPVGDIDGFVDRIRVLADDRDLLTRMRYAAWRTGREYGVDRMVDNYVACFERAVEDAKVNPRTPDPGYPLMESCRSKYPLWLRRIKAQVLAR